MAHACVEAHWAGGPFFGCIEEARAATCLLCTVAVGGLGSDAGGMYSECFDHFGTILGRLGVIQSHTSRLWPLQSETLSDGDIGVESYTGRWRSPEAGRVVGRCYTYLNGLLSHWNL